MSGDGKLIVWRLSVHKAWMDSEHWSLHQTMEGAKAAPLGEDWADQFGDAPAVWEPAERPGTWRCWRGDIRCWVVPVEVGP